MFCRVWWVLSLSRLGAADEVAEEAAEVKETAEIEEIVEVVEFDEVLERFEAIDEVIEGVGEGERRSFVIVSLGLARTSSDSVDVVELLGTGGNVVWVWKSVLLARSVALSVIVALGTTEGTPTIGAVDSLFLVSEALVSRFNVVEVHRVVFLLESGACRVPKGLIAKGGLGVGILVASSIFLVAAPVEVV